MYQGVSGVIGDDGVSRPESSWEVPAAFYRDAPTPPPSHYDPHWVEFDAEPETDDLPGWMILAMPGVLLAIFLLHVVLGVVLWLLMR